MTHRLALIGHPVSHSLSADYFMHKFAQEGIDGSYSLLDMVTLDNLKSQILSHNLTGFNVTSPHKQAVIPFLDYLTEEGKAIGAINTVAIYQGKLIGHNTDAIGFAEAILPLLKPHHTAALIFGNGGAAKAVAYALSNILHIDYRCVARRDCDLDFSDVDKQLLTNHSILINCTTLGMTSNSEPLPIPYQYITKDHLLFDLVYAPQVTPFLALGQQQGATICNGLSMLYAQAEAAWKFWNSSFEPFFR